MNLKLLCFMILPFGVIAQVDIARIVKDINPHFSGQVLLSTKGGNEISSWDTGWANRDWSIPMSDTAIMDIASLNKSFIANLCFQAVAEGHWYLDQSLNEILEGLNHPQRFHPGISLKDLMSHRAGLLDYDGVPKAWQENNFRIFKRKHFTNDGYLTFIAGLAHHPPDSIFHYSNFAYHLLAILLEELYQKDFDAILKEKIANPLGMNSICAPKSRQAVIPGLAKAYELKDGNWRSNDFIDLSLGRRIFCSAEDLMIWLENQGGAELLPDSLATLVHLNQVADISNTISYGFGWVPFAPGDSFQMGNLNLNRRYFIHGGSTEGYQSLAVSVEHGECNLVILSNSSAGPKIFEIAKTIIHEVYSL